MLAFARRRRAAVIANDPARYRVPEHVLSRRLDDEMVLLNLESGEYFGLNATGCRVWEILTDGLSAADAVAALSSEFEVEREAAAADVATLCNELRTAGLLEAADGA